MFITMVSHRNGVDLRYSKDVAVSFAESELQNEHADTNAEVRINVNCNNSRVQWLDLLKAFAIFLVTLGHVLGGLGYCRCFVRNVIYSFHMPLFFAISGYIVVYAHVMKGGEVTMGIGEACRFMCRKFHTLIFPYVLCPLLLYPIFYWRIGDPNYFQRVMKSIFVTNTAAWFLPCLFLLMSAFSAIAVVRRQFTKCPLWVFIVAMQGIVIGLHWLTGNPFLRSVESYFLPFAIGMLVARHEKVVSRKWVWIPFVVVWIVASMVFARFTNSDDSQLILLSKVARLVAGIASIPPLFALFSVAVRFKGTVGRSASYVGKCTLVIYLFQDFPISYASIGRILGTNCPDSLLLALCLAISCVVVMQGVCIDWVMRKSRILSFLFLGRKWTEK